MILNNCPFIVCAFWKRWECSHLSTIVVRWGWRRMLMQPDWKLDVMIWFLSALQLCATIPRSGFNLKSLYLSALTLKVLIFWPQVETNVIRFLSVLSLEASVSVSGRHLSKRSQRWLCLICWGTFPLSCKMLQTLKCHSITWSVCKSLMLKWHWKSVIFLSDLSASKYQILC